jgi:hypothetical protein
MILADTNPVIIDDILPKDYLVAAYSGDVVIELQTTDGSWELVEGSPLLDGQNRRLAIPSYSQKIRVSTVSAGTEFLISEAQ